MQIEFRQLLPNDPRIAASDELQIRPRDASDDGRTDLTRLALERGIEAFIHGPGTITKIIIHDDPTIDDMLAALVLEAELAGKPVPGDSPWGHYVAALRSGIRPNRNIPIEDSLEGMFAVIRHEAGESLVHPNGRNKFLTGWERLAKVVRTWMDELRDPHQVALFADRAEFNREREFLRSDHVTYERDVRRGRKWMMCLPGDPHRVAGLFVSTPESYLFKFWARNDVKAPGGAGYVFLAVKYAKAPEWFFSTDPLQRRSIQTLAHALQEAEPKTPDQHMDPWYDGRRHHHSIVVAPYRGSKLSEKQVLAVVQKWGKAKNVNTVNFPSKRAISLVTGGAACLAIVAFALTRPVHDHQKKGVPEEIARALHPATPLRKDRASELRPVRFSSASPTVIDLPIDEVESEQKYHVWYQLEKAPSDGFEVSEASIADTRHTRLPFRKKRDDFWETEPKLVHLKAGRNNVSLKLTAPTDARLNLAVCWEPEPPSFSMHVLAVGVSTYSKDSHDCDVQDLKFAKDDAEAVASAFASLPGTLAQMVSKTVLTDEKATCANVVDEIGRFKNRVNADKSKARLAVIFLAGHGEVASRDYFVYLAHDFSRQRPSTHVKWEAIKTEFLQINCPVLLLLDTCHSGLALHGDWTPRSSGNDRTRAIEELAGQRKGLYIIASSASDQQSYERPAWGHGAMTFALLKALGGQAKPSSGNVVTLQDLNNAIEDEVGRLVGDKQQVMSTKSPELLPRKIPIRMVQSGE